MIERARVRGGTEAVVEAAPARDPEPTRSRPVRDALRASTRERGIGVAA